MKKFKTTVTETDINTGKAYAKAYNSYILQGEKNALIGGAAKGMSDDIIKAADFAVFTHAYPAPGINRILDLNPNIEIVGTIAAIKNLKEITNRSFNEHIAKDGTVLNLGGAELEFLITPNLNWPDTMMVYEKSSKTLFSGMAFSSYENGDLREVYDAELSRFSPFVKAAAERVKPLDIETILPAFGDFGGNVSAAINNYIAWSAPKGHGKTAAVFYASATGNTGTMAKTVSDAMRKNGADVKLINAANTDRDEILEALYSADALAFGTPTVHHGAAKPIWDVISHIDLINMKYKPCMVFGSHGWGGEGAQYIYNHLKLLRLKPFDKPFCCYFTPSETDISELMQYTKKFLESTA